MRPLDGAAEHRHRVRVVEEDGRGAQAFDVRRDFEDRVHRAQEAEDAARPAGVADVRVHPVFLGDGEVVLPDVGPALQDCRDHAVRALKRLAAVEGGHDLGRMTPVRRDALAGAADEVQPYRVDVHQRDGGVVEGGIRQDVADEVAGEGEAPGTDECDFLGHG